MLHGYASVGGVNEEKISMTWFDIVLVPVEIVLR
jgi:hypothetical protein